MCLTRLLIFTCLFACIKTSCSILTIGKGNISNIVNSYPTLRLSYVRSTAGIYVSVTNKSLDNDTTQVEVPLQIKSIESLVFNCSHHEPIEWELECPTLHNQIAIEVSKSVTNNLSQFPNKTGLIYISHLTFTFTDTKAVVPSNFSCIETLNKSQISSVFFSEDEHRAFSFNIVQNKIVNPVCSEYDSPNSSQLGNSCPAKVFMNLDSKTFDCSASGWDSTLISCDGRLDYCQSLMKESLGNGTCICTRENITYSKTLGEVGSAILECKHLDNSTENERDLYVRVLVFIAPLQNSTIKEIYTSWDSLRKANGRLNIIPLKNNTIWDGESVIFSCSGLESLFAKHFEWFTRTRNDNFTTEQSYGLEESSTKIENNLIYQNKTFPVTHNLTQIGCRGLMSGFGEWVEAFYIPEVQRSSKPNIINFTSKTDGSSTKLSCTASGNPLPEITIHLCTSTDVSPKDARSPSKCQLGDKGERKIHPSKSSTPSVTVGVSTTASFPAAICEARNQVDVAYGHTNSSHIAVQIKKQIPILWISISVTAVVAICVGVIFFLVKLKNRQSQVVLSEEEFEAFYKGAQQHTLNPNDPSQCAILLAYDKRYEIPREKVHLDGVVLGSGQFGIVVQGKFDGQTVAVKTIRQLTDLSYFKALLAELKILIYVGNHPHIVNLIGACTGKLRKLEVLLVLDFCSNGSLVKFLRSSRSTFTDLLHEHDDNREAVPVYENARKLTTRDLIRFSCEVADAMTFIAEKNILHGDVAARNVLVTEDIHVKLCDFGLAKQLFNYAVYVQKQECPLPLRWMAIESLQDMEFSIESDTWSFGVLMWEIFTLAEIPYPGINWGFESWRMLKDGYRLEKPQYSNPKIYEIMRKCWLLNAKERPKFQEIVETLQDELDEIRHAYL